ncbi:MAG: hypothetical protein GY948_22255, partial [Alphaproteobacteria bacterium]|nr:hypothetical protein [Alphaproteobacteria bacterium]
SIMQVEFDRARQLVATDARWQAAMRKRGYKDLSVINCAPQSAGHFPSEGYGERRILKVPCYHGVVRAGREHPNWSRPIEGVIAVVDVDGGKVIDVIDAGPVIPVDAVKSHGSGPLREPALPKPVHVISPQGPNFKLKGAVQVEWHNWSFHMRADRRAGLILSLLRFEDGGQRRLVAYQLAQTEMFVPYMDPHPGWAYKSFLDAGEFGLGYLISSLERGHDCPVHAVYLNLFFPSDQGGMFKANRAVCIFERNTGDPAWRHYNIANQRAIAMPKVELVVRHVPTLGSYDYVIDYVFETTGQVRIRTGATGMDAVKTVQSEHAGAPGAEKDTAHGLHVAPYLVAPYHDHYFNFRIDLDVDGPGNTLVREHFEPRRLPEGNLRKSLWVLNRDPLKREGPLSPRSRMRGEIWRIINPSKTTALGHNPGYQLEASGSVPSLLSPDDPPQARALFTSNALWVTAHNPAELWAAGDYPNQSKGGEGLPAYTADRQALENKDLVLWYNLGFRHVTRPEDWPFLPTRWFEFKLRPYGFFVREPSHDLARHFSTKKKAKK